MTKNLVNQPLFRLFIPIPLGVLVYLVLLLINDNLMVIEEAFLSQELFFCIGLCYLTFESNGLSNRLLGNWPADSIILTFGTFLLNLCITLMVTYMALSAYFIWIVGFSSFSVNSSEMKSFGLMFGVISVLYNMIYIGHYYLTRRNDEQFASERILKDQLEFELKAYQAELRPNLFFESLESAINILHEDPDEAEHFLDKLAVVYRYVLLNRSRQLIPLDEETKAIGDLLFLLNKKYNDLISLDFDENISAGEVIPGTLPNLLEEIVNTTIISRSRPLEVSFFSEDGYLNIRYKLNERLNPMHKEDTYKQLQSAYQAVSDKPVMKVQAYGECFYKIPLVNKAA